jgi:NAD(P)-dependent dehydrogenase (short-subunit alcohol dehydrogenase family)
MADRLMRILIAGAGGALGKTVTKRFLDEGHKVACLARRADREPTGSERWFECRDLADGAAVARAIDDAADWLGGIDAVVQLAGSFAWQRVEDTTAADWTSLYSANVLTTLAVIQAALPHLASGGSIVTVGAASAQPAGEGMAAYASAKSGVARLTETLAIELGPRRIRINSVLPAIIDTPQNRQAMPTADPAGWTSTSAIADVIYFLSGPASRAINGGLIPVTDPDGFPDVPAA